eukprot:135127-Prymnesium_polylepis.1
MFGYECLPSIQATWASHDIMSALNSIIKSGPFADICHKSVSTHCTGGDEDKPVTFRLKIGSAYTVLKQHAIPIKRHIKRQHTVFYSGNGFLTVFGASGYEYKLKQRPEICTHCGYLDKGVDLSGKGVILQPAVGDEWEMCQRVKRRRDADMDFLSLASVKRRRMVVAGILASSNDDNISYKVSYPNGSSYDLDVLPDKKTLVHMVEVGTSGFSAPFATAESRGGRITRKKQIECQYEKVKIKYPCPDVRLRMKLPCDSLGLYVEDID